LQNVWHEVKYCLHVCRALYKSVCLTSVWLLLP
jgi:hypothetical protein